MMAVDDFKPEKKYEYWNHFVAAAFEGREVRVKHGSFDADGNRVHREEVYKHVLPHSVTGPKLRKIFDEIWDDEDFWSDILYRHSGKDMTPETMAMFMGDVYEHCRGNFWGMIMQTLVERGLVK